MENSAPSLKNPDRTTDPSTLRRWFRNLDSSQPAFSFLRPTLRAIADWLACGEQLQCGPLRLPALMQRLGHKDIRMTLCYVQATQQDLQREYHRARLNTASLHSIPKLPLPATTASVQADIAAIHDAIAATRHLLQLFRSQLQDDKSRCKLRRLSQRLLNLRHELDLLAGTEK